MRIAQRLKDGVELADGSIEGIITYHRTDSTTLSDKALTESGRVIREMFGGEYYQGPRRYQTKVRNAQEAHEAIRPTDFTVTPQSLVGVLEADELRLYELIWKRTMASQMPDARVLKTTVEFTAPGPGGEQCAFTAAGKAIEFPGYRRAYVEGYTRGFNDYAGRYDNRSYRNDSYYGNGGYYPNGGYSNGPYANGTYGRAYPRGGVYAANPGYNRGYNDGLSKGSEDARKHRSYELSRHDRYRSANRGYDRDYGSRYDYEASYRQGFAQGYQQAYRGNGYYR
jgi:hypothetical protein